MTPQTAPLHRIFTKVPPKYDLINRIITLGMDNGWRRQAARICLEAKPHRVLDLGCGTGDMTLDIARLSAKDTEVTGLDFSPPMLEKAREKAALAGVAEKTRFVQGEATKIPFPSNHFDCVSISFAFRNLIYQNPARMPHFAEVLRVLKPGGRYVTVESSQPRQKIIRALFHLYLKIYVDNVGTLLSGNKEAYHYLAESSAHFYHPEEIKDMLLEAGFTNIGYKPLFLGAAGIHIAFKAG